MNLLFMQNGLAPYGIPRNGLIALYDLGRQILTGTTGQTLIDYTGKGNDAQLGSTAGSDTNDPAWSGAGLVHTTDDGVTTVNNIFANMTGDFTIVFVAKMDSITNSTLGMADPTVMDQYNRLRLPVTNKLTIVSNNAKTNTESEKLTINSALQIPIVWKQKNGVMTLKRMDNGEIVTLASTNPTGSAKLGIGVLPRLSPSYAGSLVWSISAVYNRCLSDTEDARTYACLKSLMNSRGVVI